MLKDEQRLSVHLKAALGKLKKGVLTLAALTESQLVNALRALSQGDVALATKVIDEDARVDEMEVDLEEECLEVLALHQPVAHDLRVVVAILKINNDLERIGDYAVNVATRTIGLSEHYGRMRMIDYDEFGRRVTQMLRDCIESLINQDVSLALQICRSDSDIDAMHKQNYALVEEMIKENPELTPFIIQQLSVSRYLERVADLTTNIAEDVVYLVKGEIVRHKPRN